MKKVLKAKVIDPERISTQKTNEIFFRLKRPNETQAFEFICKKYIKNSHFLKKNKIIKDLENQPKIILPPKKTKTNPENEQNLYKQMQNLSINSTPTTSTQLFSQKYVLKRVEENYIKKKQEEISERNSAQKRLEIFQKNRKMPENEEIKEEIPPQFQKLASILEKYKQLEAEELKSTEKPVETQKSSKETMIFYDLNYKNNQNTILFNDKPTEYKYFPYKKTLVFI